MAALALGFVVVFLAELGDKSQLMAMAFAARYRARTVLLAITAATAVVHLFSVALGTFLGTSVPTRWVGLFSGIAFLGFGVWTLIPDTLSSGDQERADRRSGAIFFSIFGAFFLAELGDKTMVATVLLSVDYGWVAIWLGSTLGMVAADGLAIGVGVMLGKVLPVTVLRVGAGMIFLLGGALLILDALLRA